MPYPHLERSQYSFSVFVADFRSALPNSKLDFHDCGNEAGKHAIRIIASGDVCVLAEADPDI